MSSVSRFSGVLAGSEATLRPANGTLTTIATSPDLTASEVAKLKAAGDAVLALRLRRENPILERVYNSIVARLEGGAEVKALTAGETSALLTLIGSVSHAENDVLKQLKDHGLITPASWDSLVVAHREASNTAQAAQFSKLKWGVAAFFNFTSPMVAAYTIGSLLSGPAGAIAAGGVALGVAVGVLPRVQGVITKKAKEETAVLGMNALTGLDQLSELTLLTARASRGDVLTDNGQKLIDRVRNEVELGNLLIEGRSYAKLGLDELEQKIAGKVGAYHEGLADLLAQADAGKITEKGLRDGIVALRAELLDAGLLDRASREVGAGIITNTDDARALRYLDAAAFEQGPALIAALDGAMGMPNAAAKTAAQEIITAAAGISGDAGVPPSQTLLGLLDKVLAGQTLSSGERSTLKAEVSKAKAQHADLLPELLISEDESRSKAKELLELIFGQVIAAYTGEEHGAKIKGMKSEMRAEGGFTVTGSFAGPGWFTKSGSFSVNFDERGGIDMSDPGSVRIDLGADNIQVLGGEAIKKQLELMGIGGKAKKPAVAEKGTGETKRYELSGAIKGGEKSAYRFDMTPVGFVDWQSMKIS